MKLVKNFSPRGAHITGMMGGYSEEKKVKAAKQRLKMLTNKVNKVDRFAVSRYVR